ncbi:gamma-glutamylcyclotransferase family protein [Cyclobacterium xiamenense]|jgi:gamma-glutamylcyclotransferase (GGCT)/AIG2-like uncharacterized protein YtfP|uniref:gamma-glutamylcyclotransferase family protein n=1 Tax=Cyclobacterium xiamenense TaxID=1297121 RepID=UPI0012B98A40|nr:gamma-glutamylcyclotransferase family protein [Cyclobacterium xiamenense]
MAAVGTLFVYGTLRRGFAHPMAKTLEELGRYLGRGTFQGRLYDRGPYPVAVLSSDPSHRVYGDVYALEAEERVLELMDEYEGVGELLETGVTFERKQTAVRLADGSRKTAWIYLHSGYTDHFVPIAGGDYLAFKNR